MWKLFCRILSLTQSNLMYIDLDPFCFEVLFTMIFAAVFSIATGVGGFEWPISARAVSIDVALRQFSNNPPNSASVADSITFLITLHSTCNGPFYRYINCIGVFDFGTRKNTHLLFFVPLVLICRMHPNIYGESFRFFCIMLLHLYVNCCNLKID